MQLHFQNYYFFLHFFFVKKDTLVLNIQNKQTKLFEWENNSLGKSKKIVGIFQKKLNPNGYLTNHLKISSLKM